MSIANNVILENEKLATALTLLRAKITNTRNSSYYSDEDLNILLSRFMSPNKITDMTNWASDWYIMKDETKTGRIRITPYVEGEVIAVYIDNDYVGSYVSDSNGYVDWTYIGNGSSTDYADKTIYFRHPNYSWSLAYTDALYYCADSENLADSTTLSKYPSSTSVTVESGQEEDYNDCIKFSKTYGYQQFAYLFPNDISAYTNLKVRALIKSTHSSSSGWREGICLCSSNAPDSNYPYGYYLMNSPSNCKITSGNQSSESIIASRGSQLDVSSWFIYEMSVEDLTLHATVYDEYEDEVWDSGDITIPEETRCDYYPALYIGDYGGGMYCSNFQVYNLGD